MEHPPLPVSRAVTSLPPDHPDKALSRIGEAVAATWGLVAAVNAIPHSHADDVWIEPAMEAWEHAKSRLEDIIPTTAEGLLVLLDIQALCEDAERALGAPRCDPPPLSGLMERARTVLMPAAA